MDIERLSGNESWYRCTYLMDGRICGGHGKTHSEALADCLEDMKIVASICLGYDTAIGVTA